MKVRYAASVALLAGFTLGGIAVERIHAQPKRPAYTIAEVEVTDEAGYKEYVRGTSKAVPAAGGQFIVRGGRSFVVNGAPPKRVVVIQWESYEKADAFFNSEAYKQLIPLRDKSSNSRLYVVEGAAN